MLKHSGQDCSCTVGNFCHKFAQSVDAYCINLCKGCSQDGVEEHTYQERAAIINSIAEQNNNIFNCIHRGEVIERQECGICSQKNYIAQIYKCDLHSKCTVRSHGLKCENGEKMQVCYLCSDRQSSHESNTNQDK